MRNKKGLSDVVSNVLIILIVVAAVAILGLIVINLVKSIGGGVTQKAICQSLEVKPTTCSVTGTGTAATTTASIIRGSGDGSIVISKVMVNFMVGSTTKQKILSNDTLTSGLGGPEGLTPGEVVSATSDLGISATEVGVAIEGLYTDAEGKKQTLGCAFEQAVIPCA